MHREYESTMNRNRGCADLILIVVLILALAAFLALVA